MENKVWAEFIHRLNSSIHFQIATVEQLLNVEGGGPCVARLLQKAATQLSASPEPEFSQLKYVKELVVAVHAILFEKIHLGVWKDVLQVWRDAFSASCILLAVLEAQFSLDDSPSTLVQIRLASCYDVETGVKEFKVPVRLKIALEYLDKAMLLGGRSSRQLILEMINHVKEVAGLNAFIVMTAHAADNGNPLAPLVEKGDGPSSEFSACSKLLTSALPEGSYGPRSLPIEDLDSMPSLEMFASSWLNKRPLILSRGLVDTWPAFKRWKSRAYLLAVAGPHLVPVEIGANYLDSDWGQQLMSFQEFWNRCMGKTEETMARYANSSVVSSASNEDHLYSYNSKTKCLREGTSRSNDILYLAQHDLLDQIPDLGRDIQEPEYCILAEKDETIKNTWFGPSGTITPCHTDPYQNLFCQVFGKKYIRLYPPNSTNAMYPFPDGMHSNTSQIDFHAPPETLAKRFPLFLQTPFYDCILESGQSLYIPPGWWHYVQSLTPSASVSFWWK